MAARTNISQASGSPGILQTNENALRDIKPPVVIPNGWLWAMWITIGLLAAATLLWWYRRWKARRPQIPAAPPIPPHVRARQKLDEALRIIEQPKPFCTMVSDTTRI